VLGLDRDTRSGDACRAADADLSAGRVRRIRPVTGDRRRRRLLWVQASATFLVFFQAFMIAPLIPLLADELGVSPQRIGLAIPAYMVSYGVATLLYGLASDRWGRRWLTIGSLAAFVVLTAATATAQSASQLIVWRLATGVGAAAVVPLSLAHIGANYPFERRGQPLGWLFAAMAGGMAFGSSLGAVAAPLIGWRGLFVAVALSSAAVLGLFVPRRDELGGPPEEPAPLTAMLGGFRAVLSTPRARRTYTYVALNSVFHSGTFTWFGLYFTRRHGLGEIGIALAIVGYGLPGFLFGPSIGRAADRYGRRRILPIGLATGALGAAALIPDSGVVAAAVAVLVVSLGYDLTQPLLAGIVTAVGGPQRAGQAMGLNVFVLFTGFGVGAFVFGEALTLGFADALAIFAVSEASLALVGFWLFRGEAARSSQRSASGAPT
jgi:predicted MFS family arabinose efflux permease